jgi:flavin reductase (DIM6/NTAB) family NADH-FMN oxidoreductase RutF
MNQPYQNSSDRRTLRNALGEFATGITVVTAHVQRRQGGRRHHQFLCLGFARAAAGAVEPWPALAVAGGFRVVQPLCDQRACRRPGRAFAALFAVGTTDELAGIDLSIGAGGTPILPGCCAWFECRNEIRYPGGDHLILVGYVESFRREKAPLVFHGGRYRELA